MNYYGNPNGAKQLWSKWTFHVREYGRHMPKASVEWNVGKWLIKGFGSAGRVRVRQDPRGWDIECLIEGPPAHDPAFVSRVAMQFQRDFVDKGWGPMSVGTVEVKVMAGDMEDGKPRRQMIELPAINYEALR